MSPCQITAYPTCTVQTIRLESQPLCLGRHGLPSTFTIALLLNSHGKLAQTWASRYVFQVLMVPRSRPALDLMDPAKETDMLHGIT